MDLILFLKVLVLGGVEGATEHVETLISRAEECLAGARAYLGFES